MFDVDPLTGAVLIAWVGAMALVALVIVVLRRRDRRRVAEIRRVDALRSTAAREHRAEVQALTAEVEAAHRERLAAAQETARARPGKELVAQPPMVGGVTLYHHLIHHTSRDGVWPEVVAEFYRRASGVPVVADFFRDTVMDRQRNHFHRALVKVTNTGVTVAQLEDLRQIHATRARSSDGSPITAEIWDLVVATLVGILQEYGVAQQWLTALAKTLEPIREALVPLEIEPHRFAPPTPTPSPRPTPSSVAHRPRSRGNGRSYGAGSPGVTDPGSYGDTFGSSGAGSGPSFGGSCDPGGGSAGSSGGADCGGGSF